MFLLATNFYSKLKYFYKLRANIDLTKYEVDKSHFMKIPLEDGTGTISLLASITGISSNDQEPFSVPDLYRDEYALKLVKF